MEDNDRPRKRQKLFQGSLPAEMIENILNNCSCLITLESLACTCKQINALVSNIFKKSVVVRVQLIDDEERKTAKYVIKGNGDAFKRTKYSRNPPGFTNEKINSVQKKLYDRFELDKLVSKLLNIINMTDWPKLKSLLAKHESKQLLELGHDKIVFDIQVNTQRIRYLHIDEDVSIGGNEDDENSIMNSEYENDSGEDKPVRTSEEEAEDPDLDTARREDWDELDEMMIKRLKCALCVLKMKKFYSNIQLDRKQADHVIISYGNDEISNEGWEVQCYDTGYVYGQVTDWSDRQWDFRDERQLSTMQYRPSLAKFVFENVRTYMQSYLDNHKESTKAEKSNAVQNDNKSEDSTKDNDNSDKENDDDDSKSSDEDEKSDKETRSRSIKMVLNGTQYSFKKMSDEDLAGLMDTLTPLTLPLGLDFEY